MTYNRSWQCFYLQYLGGNSWYLKQVRRGRFGSLRFVNFYSKRGLEVLTDWGGTLYSRYYQRVTANLKTIKKIVKRIMGVLRK